MSRAWYENYSVHVHFCRESRCIGHQYIASLSILYLDEQTILYVHPPGFLHVGILSRVGGLVLWVEWEPFRTTQCDLCGSSCCIQYVDHRSMMWLGFIHCVYINQSSGGFIHNSSLSSFYFTL